MRSHNYPIFVEKSRKKEGVTEKKPKMSLLESKLGVKPVFIIGGILVLAVLIMFFSFFGMLGPVVDGALGLVEQGVAQLGQLAGTMLDLGSQVVTQGVGFVGDTLSTATAQVPGMISSAQGLGNVALNAVGNAYSMYGNVASSAISSSGMLVNGALGNLSTVGMAYINLQVGMMQSAAAGGSSIFSAALTSHASMVESYTGIAESCMSTIQVVNQQIILPVVSIMNALISIPTSMFFVLGGLLMPVLPVIACVPVAVVGHLLDLVTSDIGAMLTIFSSAFNSTDGTIVQAIQSIPTQTNAAINAGFTSFINSIHTEFYKVFFVQP